VKSTKVVPKPKDLQKTLEFEKVQPSSQMVPQSYLIEL